MDDHKAEGTNDRLLYNIKNNKLVQRHYTKETIDALKDVGLSRGFIGSLNTSKGTYNISTYTRHRNSIKVLIDQLKLTPLE